MKLAAWFRRPAAAGRWLVLDVEASGLDPRHDRLLAIAAVAVQQRGDQLRITPGDSFELVLRQPEQPADKANILIHGIGVAAQRAGVDPAGGLREFVAFAGPAPLIAFHAGFDRTLIERELREVLGQRMANRWLDLADLAPVLAPQVKAQALDEWLNAFSIVCAARHQAAADALATAELLLRLWPLARAQGRAASFDALTRIAAARRWLSPS